MKCTHKHKVGPVITPFEFPRRTQLGNRIRLLCSIMQGDAPFRFQWLKDGKMLDPSPLSLGVRSDDFSMDLTFSRVTPRHNGNYTCIASNDVASVSHSAILVVDGTSQYLTSFLAAERQFSLFPDVSVGHVSCVCVCLSVRVCVLSPAQFPASLKAKGTPASVIRRAVCVFVT